MPGATEVANAGAQNLAAYANALFEEAIAGPREQLGERLFRMSLTAWENPQLRPQLLAKIRSATTSEEGAAALRDHFSAMLVERVGEVVGAPRLNLNAVVAQVVGLIMLRYVMRMEPIASASVDELVDTFAPTIQRHLDA
ncbi:TetR/AcrR family transcriptional regulator [Streptomyces broussonetiae]|uniref:TetR/AcrR family transcriptional regulator n=1 Tax=Streptomyces broussonetiae TaxID=2686304 RepID=UPI0035E10A1E